MAEENLGSLTDLYVIQENGKKAMAVTGGGQALDVAVQDLTTAQVRLFLGEFLDDITVLVDTVKDEESIDIETTGITPLIGDFLCLQELRHISQFEVVSVTPIAGNQYTIGLSMPIDFPYTTAGGCRLLDVDMNKDGSTTPIDYAVGPALGVDWHITRMMPSMVLSTKGDDGLFGNLPAVANGQYFRKENTEETENYFNIKDNSDWAIEGYDIRYPERSGGGGSHGMTARITFEKNGSVIELKGDMNHLFRGTNRDDLTGLVKYRIKLQGHVTSED